MQSIEVWKQKTLLLTDWSYQTTLGWDSPVPLAALFYGITNNIFVSYGMATNVFICLYIYIFNDLMKELKVFFNGRCLALILLFIPFSMGQLGYFTMVFVEAAFYIVKALIAVLLILILVKLHNNKKPNWFLYSLSALFVFTTTVSTGYYIVLCVVIPLFLYELFYAVTQGRTHFKSKMFVVPVIWVCIGILGKVAAMLWGINDFSSGKTLITAQGFVHNAEASLVGIFELLGAIPSLESVKIISLNGIMYVSRFLVTIILVGNMVYSFASKKTRQGSNFIMLSLFLCVINMSVLWLSDLTYGSPTYEYRYHTIWIMPIFILFALSFDRFNQAQYETNQIVFMSNKENHIPFNKIMTYCVAAFVCLTAAISYYGCYKEVYPPDDYKRTNSILEQEDIGLAYVYGDDLMVAGRSMRVFTEKVNYITIFSNGSPRAWGGSTKYFDNSAYSGRTALITKPAVYDTLPDYIRNGYEQKESVNEYTIYISEENGLDCAQGLPENGASIDFPYTFGFMTSNASVDNTTGDLVTDGSEGYVLWGPYSEPKKGVYKITLNYDIINADGPESGVFDIACNNGQQILAQTSIIKGQDSVTIDSVNIEPENTGLEFRVWNNDGTVMRINSIQYEKVGE
jgi:hypothetical protein